MNQIVYIFKTTLMVGIVIIAFSCRVLAEVEPDSVPVCKIPAWHATKYSASHFRNTSILSNNAVVSNAVSKKYTRKLHHIHPFCKRKYRLCRMDETLCNIIGL